MSESVPAGAADVAGASLLETRFQRDASLVEGLRLSAEQVQGLAAGMLQLGSRRSPRTPVIAVTGDWAAGLTALGAVTDDMPFLVDSLTAALGDLGYRIDLLLHPQLSVERDEHGTALSIAELHAGAPLPAGTLAEAWMCIVVQREHGDADTAQLADRVAAVLAEVRAAVGDWSVMLRSLRDAASDLRQRGPAGLPAADLGEAAELGAWLAADHLTLLGSMEVDGDARALVPDPGSARGILRGPRGTELVALLDRPAAGLAAAGTSDPVRIGTLPERSAVHRAAHVDVVTVGRYDQAGALSGELRLLGLLTASAYATPITEIPQVRTRFTAALAALDVLPGSHSARDLQQFFETYPRGELLQLSARQFIELAESVLLQGDPRRTRLYLRIDADAHVASAVVYLARDRYTTEVRLRLADLLTSALGGTLLDYTALVAESAMARLHYLIRLDGSTPAPVDPAGLENAVAMATQTWSDLFAAAVHAALGEGDAAREFLRTFAEAFPAGYRERFDPAAAVAHARAIADLAPGALGVRWESAGAQADGARLTLLRVGEPLSLSRIIPILHDIGLEVRSEHPFSVNRHEAPEAWVLDFTLRLVGEVAEPETLSERVSGLIGAVWAGRCESDGFSRLVLLAGLTWREVALLRAYASHLRQILASYDSAYVQEVLASNPAFARLLVDLARRSLDPAWVGDRVAARTDAEQAALVLLDDVSSLDHDRILRFLLTSVLATTRTNAFTAALTADPNAESADPHAGMPADPALCLKFDPSAHPEIPEPRPFAELWVHSPRVRGTHLRFGSVARGGLRWSDRREDVRTEVLDLVKAQIVKNAIIVPTGAKGGFVPIGLPDPAVDRDRWLATGTAAYREFVTALLSVTDTLLGGAPVSPAGVVCRDGADPYLVVAADKGTATFSDLANGIAVDRGFWLGDAFASGGSRGYDHKAMGITARGAWESVRRHFAELGLNTQVDPFTVVGIGDMSGDVFGNGMLLSESIRLIAAFDHRHIFIDPDPPAAAFAERRRLFDLPRSSWADYDPSLISPGGGVYSRGAKSIMLSDAAWQVLGLPADPAPLTVVELVRAILMAPVDLLWNGGIGTYVKATAQSSLDVGDKANDGVRINGDQLRVRVVGEGGNLGLTQAGRVEAALAGVRLNTDALDNSAGVDTSDHEVNLKILLQPIVAAGRLSEPARDELLASMTEAVAEHVLSHNYAQNVILGAARSGALGMVSVHRRMLTDLEQRGLLDRRLAGLPDDAHLEVRAAAGHGLTSPELAVLLAYAKISLRRALDAEGLTDPWYAGMLGRYFPTAVQGPFEAEIATHPLRDAIIHTVVTNWLVELGGVTFLFRACDETGAGQVEVVRAATVAAEVFGLQQVWQEIAALDYQVASAVQDGLHIDSRRLLDRATRWVLGEHGGALDVGELIARYRPVVAQWSPRFREHLADSPAQVAAARARRYAEAGVPADLAQRVAIGLDTFVLLDLTEVSRDSGEPIETLLALYQELTGAFSIDPVLLAITGLPRGEWWSVQARHALRADVYALIRRLTGQVAGSTDPTAPAAERVARWQAGRASAVTTTRRMIDQVLALPVVDLAALSVLLREMRALSERGR